MSENIKELVKRLRGHEPLVTHNVSGLFLADAADTLEAMAWEVERLTSDVDALGDNLEKVVAERDRLKAALVRLVKSVGDECFLDHNGNCQAHFIDSPCAMAIARKALRDAS